MGNGPRPPDQRSAENTRYRDRHAAAGIMRVTVMVPAERVSQLRALTLAWRREAKMLLLSDLPTADQILEIHGVCRTLGMKLPIQAFETRFVAEQWLLTQQDRLEGRVVHVPKRPTKQ